MSVDGELSRREGARADAVLLVSDSHKCVKEEKQKKSYGWSSVPRHTF